MTHKAIYKRILSSCIVLSMVLTGFATLFVGGPGLISVVKADEVLDTLPLLRVYGEEHAIYPTHSYYGVNDFIYPKEYDPFDPGIIEKDSITFNPAFWHGHDDYEIKAQGDASEKVFLRAFYEPEYTHGIDAKMQAWSNVVLYPVETFDGIITETTFFLTDLEKTVPRVGYPGETEFVFPYESTDADLPGMENADLIDVVQTSGMNTPTILTDGRIKIEKEFEFFGDYINTPISFLDHEIRIRNYENNDPDVDKLDLEVSYIGNMYHELTSTDSYTIPETFWQFDHYFDRDNLMQMNTDPAYRWYLRVVNADNDYLRIVLGRVLCAGETFYVDGVRYDMPAIYVDNTGGFKYITLQSPIPKGETIWETRISKNVDDWSHVTSQYLASLPMNHCVWVLPPFNWQHKMIDDIGLQKYTSGCVEIPVDGLLLEEIKDPLCFKYVAETIEERFDSSLAERLNTSMENDYPVETWEWYNVYTKPYRYTEFVLPNQEMEVDAYDPDDIPSWYPYDYADGNEYLITTSLIAPNSHVDLDGSDRCKEFDEHEIYDRTKDIAYGRADIEQSNETYHLARVVYEFDAVDPTDLYINEATPNPTVRIYGEDDFYYPTHSYYGAIDFVYSDESDPFDPGVIAKDSITFNPAFWHGHEDYEIKAQGDASEKIFLRAYYEPGYTHTIDRLMDAFSDVMLYPVEEFDGIITETTFFLTDLDKTVPRVGYPGETEFVFPYLSNDDQNPGMEYAELVKVVATEPQGSGQLTDGAIKVEKEFEYNNIDYTEDIVISFLDHKVTIKNFENNDPEWDKLDLEVSYIGNMHEAATSTDLHTIFEDSWSVTPSFEYYYDRDNAQQTTTDPANRWYLRVENADDDYLRIVLGRWLYAGETFYVDGVRYDMPAIYVDDQGGFKYITLQSPIPKADPITDTTIWYGNLEYNINDWSHVTSQYLASLPVNHCVWVLPPFNDDHKMIDDIDLQKYNTGCVKIPADGLLLEDIKDPLCFKYTAETIEERFESSLAERLYTIMGDTLSEVWQWYNVYTLPNKYTEFMLPNQETQRDMYDVDDIPDWYPYEYADGNEYLITSSFFAPNSKLDTDRTDLCKVYDDHEIYYKTNGGDGHGGDNAQLAMILDGSGSIDSAEWALMLEGVASSLENPAIFPQDGSIELTVVQFATNARVEISPTVITSANIGSIAATVRAIPKTLGSTTNMSKGFTLAADTLKASPLYDSYSRKVVNLVTDGVPTDDGGYTSPVEQQLAIAARNYLVDTLEMLTVHYGEIDSEGIGNGVDIPWLRDNIVWPTGYEAPPFTGPGWVRYVESFADFHSALDEKFKSIFTNIFPRFVFEFDAEDGTGIFINGDDNLPPDCDCGGPYTANAEQTSISLNGCGSTDLDGTIVTYEWTVDSSNVYTGSACTYALDISSYSAGTYTVELCVTDDDGATACCETTLTITPQQNIPPDCDCGGPYTATGEATSITLDGCGSSDPDGTIDNYQWKVDGSIVYTGSACTYSLSLSSYTAGSHMVELCVTDNDGAPECCETTLNIGSLDCYDVTMADIAIPCEGIGSGYLVASGGTAHVGSGEFTILYDPAVVSVTNVDDSDFETMTYYDDGAGTVSITAWCTNVYLDGTFNIAQITFACAGINGDSCPLVIDDCHMYLDTPSAPEICTTSHDGSATIGEDTPVGGGDMNDDGSVNSADVRYLALHLAGDPAYVTLPVGEGDVNSDGLVNSADVRYLALHLAGDPLYTVLYP